ncbi:MAG: tetratricopeptide repeat protein [Planctomycetota bacterium]
MRWLTAVLWFLAACAAPEPEYVPGGADLPDAARRNYKDAVLAELRGDVAEAIDGYAALCERYPTRLAFHLARIRLVRTRGGPDAARSLYDPAPPGVDPLRAQILSGFCDLKEGDLPARRDLLAFAREKEPTEPYWMIGEADLEMRALEKVLDRAAQERARAEVDDVRKTLEDAEAMLERARVSATAAAEKDAGFAAAHQMLGYIAARHADLVTDFDRRDELRHQAEREYARAVELDPFALSARLNLAENHLFFSANNKAIKELRTCAELAPGEAAVWRNLGLAYFREGRLDESTKAYERAIELDPDNARAHAALADCLHDTGQDKDALERLHLAWDKANDDRGLRAEIAFKLAAIYEYEGAYKQAIEQYELHVKLGGAESGKAEYRIRQIYERAFE